MRPAIHQATKAERDYAELVRRLESLPRAAWRLEIAGLVAGYSFFAVRREVAGDAPTILLTGGMHGDEPAGVEAALQWMEGHDWRSWHVNWLVLPCLNPFGWTHDQRTNSDGQDINRHFRPSGQCAEAELVKRATGQQRFLLAMDFHEDSDSDGYYFCESKTRPPFAGERIVKRMAMLIPINEGARLDGRRAEGPGWVLRLARRNAFERRRQWPLAFHLAACCTDHFLCSETPTGFPLFLRVHAHLAALQEVLRFATMQPERTTQPETSNSI
jgi:murein peptide amidase A